MVDSNLAFLLFSVRFSFFFSSRDAKIAALEKTSQESEKIIAEARSDKLRQMDEVYAAQKKVTDLESRFYRRSIFIYLLV